MALIGLLDSSIPAQKFGISCAHESNMYFDDVSVEHTESLANYTYDPNGNMTSGGGRTISWDAENRPSSIVMNGITTTFTYDGDGKRIKKTETNGSAITTTVYIGNYCEITGNGTVTDTVKYYYANGKRIAMRRNGSLSYLFSGHLGGTSVVVDSTTGMTSTASYYPFASGGNPVECSRAGEHP